MKVAYLKIEHAGKPFASQTYRNKEQMLDNAKCDLQCTGIKSKYRIIYLRS